MDRILKPSVEYNKENVFEDAPFFSSNHWFVHHILQEYGNHMRNVLDIACGPAKIPVLISKQRPDINITGMDSSEDMLEIAREATEGLNIDIVYGTIPGACIGTFDTVLSKDFYHYLPDPSVFWEEVSRFSREGTAIYVLDFIRPNTEAAAMDLVERVMPYETTLLKEDFYTSLCAGFALAEVEEQVKGLGLEVLKTSEAHFLVKGRIRPYKRQSATFIKKPQFPEYTPQEGDFHGIKCS